MAVWGRLSSPAEAAVQLKGEEAAAWLGRAAAPVQSLESGAAACCRACSGRVPVVMWERCPRQKIDGCPGTHVVTSESAGAGEEPCWPE